MSTNPLNLDEIFSLFVEQKKIHPFGEIKFRGVEEPEQDGIKKISLPMFGRTWVSRCKQQLL
jgi:hypothetical protein